MDKLILIGPTVSLACLFLRGFGWTFCYWYIPLMLLFPAYLNMDGPGIPPLSLYGAAFLPFLLRPELYRAAVRDFHWLDIFVYLFMVTWVLSEYQNTGFSSARQMVLLGTLGFWGPYTAAKHVFLHERREISLARVFLIAMTLIGIYSLYTFRFGVNHYFWLRARWPHIGNMPDLAVWPRWGFFRASGPFMHPIASGIAFGFALPISLWLQRVKGIKPWYVALGMLGACCLGLVTSLSRGPFIGAIVALALYLAGQAKVRVPLFAVAGFLLLVMLPPVAWQTADYFDATRSTATSSTQETAIYRRDLILNYLHVIGERPLLGYGMFNIPYVGDQTSIDNAYIYLALTGGVFHAFSIFGIMAFAMLGLFPIGFRAGLSPLRRGEVWAIMGGLAGCGFSLATVFLSRPLNSVLMIWCAWAAAVMMRRKNERNPEDGDAEIVTEAESEKPGLVIL